MNINQQWLAGEAPIYFDGFAQDPLISGISEPCLMTRHVSGVYDIVS